ncbi:hypothetical protein L596_030177 [Steinernema carpocapsae]|uniref:Uncharacterized protein n=1 Tax=Steinernema carpocapsae TaxID=34508 RepID=A0A4U5LRZ6_STECR|nr:hypothetical protein L596_030177 [Steinernema carpocapsae]
MDGFDAEDHFDEILETILQCKSVQKCSVLAKRGSCTQTQIQAFLKALIDAGRTLTIHGLSISDHHYNGAMKDLNAYEYKGHHLTFFSNCAEPSSGPDLALVCEKNNGPAVVVIEKTTENQLFHTKFLGNIIRSELQQQKLSSMTMIRITGHFAFDEDVLVVNATIAGSETPLKEHFFDCKRVEKFMNRWFRKTFPAYKFKFTLTPEAIPEEPRRTWSFREMARNFLGRKTEEEVSDDSQARPNDTQWYEGPLKDLKAKDTLVVYNTTREMRRDVHDYARDTALINEILARRQEMIRRRRFEY